MPISKIKVFLQLLAIAHICGGLLLPVAVNTVVFDTYNAQFFLALGATTAQARAQADFLLGLLGPTIASWGVLFLYIVTTAFEHPTRRGWWAMIAACLAWAPYDSFLSIRQGIYLNAALNLLVSLCILIPLLWVRAYFLGNTTKSDGPSA